MLENLILDNSLDEHIESYINSLHKATSTIEKSFYSEKDYIMKIITLSQAEAFLKDLRDYFEDMNLSDESIDKIVIGLDELIDEFEEIPQNKSSDKFVNEYHKKVEEFLNLLIEVQHEIAFYKVERNYEDRV